jgi:hypothetical protein
MRKRIDDYKAIQGLYGREKTRANALIVMGGPSVQDWEKLTTDIHADLLVGVNGVVLELGEHLDYCLNMEAWDGRDGEPPGFNDDRPKTRIMNWKRREQVTNPRNVIFARRGGPCFTQNKTWSIRSYPNGLATGPAMRESRHLKHPTPVGTIAMQALHLCGILGLREVHTIGLDLCFRGDQHHWFNYPQIKHNNRYWHESMWTRAFGLDTLHWWVESAECLARMKSKMGAEGLTWIDHSNGLLQAMGVF